jgi:hypothetical protein
VIAPPPVSLRHRLLMVISAALFGLFIATAVIFAPLI